MNVGAKSGMAQPARPRTAPKTVPDTDSLGGATGLEAALGNLPDSRLEAVALARQLISDSDYPSPGVIGPVSQFLAINLSVASRNADRE